MLAEFYLHKNCKEKILTVLIFPLEEQRAGKHLSPTVISSMCGENSYVVN